MYPSLPYNQSSPLFLAEVINNNSFPYKETLEPIKNPAGG